MTDIPSKITDPSKFFQDLLTYLLIEEPPKRMFGVSSWESDIVKGLVVGGVLKGKLEPCCEKWCNTEAPCGYNLENYEDAEKQLKELIRKTTIKT